MAGDNFDKGWVYVLHFDIPGIKANYYKIGLSKNPITGRIATLQTGNPFKIIEEHGFDSECIGLLEGHLHKTFAKNRFRKEWFLLTPSKLKEVKQEGRKFNDKFSPLAATLRSLDKKESIHKVMPPSANHLHLHKKALDLHAKVNGIELKKDIAKEHLRRLTGNTLGINGICNFYSLEIPNPSIKGSILKIHDLNEWKKWQKVSWKMDVGILGTSTKAKSHPKLDAELKNIKAGNSSLFDPTTYAARHKSRSKGSKQYHQTVIDCVEKIGQLKVELDLIIIEFKLDCKRRKGIDKVFKYIRSNSKVVFDKTAFAVAKPQKAYKATWYHSSSPSPKFKVENAISYS